MVSIRILMQILSFHVEIIKILKIIYYLFNTLSNSKNWKENILYIL